MLFVLSSPVMRHSSINSQNKRSSVRSTHPWHAGQEGRIIRGLLLLLLFWVALGSITSNVWSLITQLTNPRTGSMCRWMNSPSIAKTKRQLIMLLRDGPKPRRRDAGGWDRREAYLSFYRSNRRTRRVIEIVKQFPTCWLSLRKQRIFLRAQPDSARWLRFNIFVIALIISKSLSAVHHRPAVQQAFVWDAIMHTKTARKAGSSILIILQ